MEAYSITYISLFNFTNVSSLLPWVPVVTNQKLHWGGKGMLFVIFHKLSFVNINSAPLAAVQEEAHICFGVYHSVVTVSL